VFVHPELPAKNLAELLALPKAARIAFVLIDGKI